MFEILIVAGALFIGWYLFERQQRKTSAMSGGLKEDVTLPHDQTWELYHNNFSLCSKKTRVCLSELGISYKSHHIDLIETGSYENISRHYLKVNPGALVPVLVHDGHPIYESHEQLTYASQHSATPDLLVPSDPALKAIMDEWVRQGSLIGDDPIADLDAAMGNAIPGLTLPIFSTMIEAIPYWKIFEGLLFHRLKERALFFVVLKLLGPRRLGKLTPARKVLARSKIAMHEHLDKLEAQLSDYGPWIVGDQFTLADVGMMVIFDRLDEVDWMDEFLVSTRPEVTAYWARIRERRSYQEALEDFDHETVSRGRLRITELKQTEPEFAATLAA